MSAVPGSLARSGWRTAVSLPLAGRVWFFFVVLWLAIAVLGASIAPYDVGAVVSPDVFGPLSAAYPLGTDYLGRDMLSRVLYAGRFTVGLALVAALAASFTGTTLALVAATAGGWTDEVVSRLMDAFISIPSKMLALVMVAAFGSSVGLLILTAALSYTPGAFRIARSLAVNVKTLEYVQAARARGEGLAYIAAVEILPNMVNPMLADFGLRFVFVVLLLSGMSFLGLGVQPPTPSWGMMISDGRDFLYEAPWMVLGPGVAILCTSIGINLFGDFLRDTYDPRLERP